MEEEIVIPDPMQLGYEEWLAEGCRKAEQIIQLSIEENGDDNYK